ncbi:hypothetical protein [Candidatus Amarolinea dominans]|uniref:hypothetical protein n=1 Tax=Candidatus Amarolinea dominans TaxID=3140696 RepID=UPI001DDCC25D|nr:hypothetical protein [Anaerolineae bacterium]
MTAQTTAQTTALSAKMTALDKVWAAIALLTPLWLAFLTPLQRLDVWWHLKVGEAIVQTGQIPTVDIYSFTANGTPYGYANVWLADVIFYGLYRSGGPALLIGMTGLLLCAACGLSWHLAFQRSASARLATVASLAGAVLIIRFGAARPQIFSIILFALFFWLLGQARARGQGRWLWPLPLLMALWANLHGAFPLGLLLIVFFLGEGLLRYGLKQPLPAERRLLLALAACLLASVAAAGVNPAGYAVFSTVQGIMGAPAVQQLALEWQAQDIKLGADLPFFALCALTFLALIYTPSRPWIGDVLLLGGFCAWFERAPARRVAGIDRTAFGGRLLGAVALAGAPRACDQKDRRARHSRPGCAAPADRRSAPSHPVAQPLGAPAPAQSAPGLRFARRAHPGRGGRVYGRAGCAGARVSSAVVW